MVYSSHSTCSVDSKSRSAVSLELEFCRISNIKTEGETIYHTIYNIPVISHTFITYHKGGKMHTSLSVPPRAYSAQVENTTALVFLVEIR